jgi:HSP20 family molecular chaperone IbpA
MSMKWLLFILMSFSVSAQHDTEGREKIMKMRMEMHRRMMQKLLNGIGPDEGMFSDMEQMMNDMMKDSFNGFDSYAQRPQNFKSRWSESSAGRTLEITPNGPDQQLDINVANNMITIKGKTEIKSANGIQVSNFTNSFNVPSDVEASKMKMDLKNGTILVFFPYWKRTDDKRKPTGPSDKDIQI